MSITACQGNSAQYGSETSSITDSAGETSFTEAPVNSYAGAHAAYGRCTAEWLPKTIHWRSKKMSP